jgi:DUF917 family protein
MTGEAMKKIIIRNTFTKARDVGKIIRENQGINASDFLQRLKEEKQIQGYLLFEGIISNIENKTIGGFDFGKVTIKRKEVEKVEEENIEEEKVEEVYAIHQNENLSAFLIKEDKKVKPLAFAPDLICYMELDENKIKRPLSNVDVQKNKEVALIGFKADEKLREAYFLEIYAKVRENLGDFYEYQPIEDLS